MFFNDKKEQNEKKAFPDGNGGLVIESKQDISKILNRNKTLLEVDKKRTKPTGDLHKIASLPNIVIDELNQKKIMKGFAIIDQKEFRKWLNKPEQSVFKIYRGKV